MMDQQTSIHNGNAAETRNIKFLKRLEILSNLGSIYGEGSYEMLIQFLSPYVSPAVYLQIFFHFY